MSGGLSPVTVRSQRSEPFVFRYVNAPYCFYAYVFDLYIGFNSCWNILNEYEDLCVISITYVGLFYCSDSLLCICLISHIFFIYFIYIIILYVYIHIYYIVFIYFLYFLSEVTKDKYRVDIVNYICVLISATSRRIAVRG